MQGSAPPLTPTCHHYIFYNLVNAFSMHHKGAETLNTFIFLFKEKMSFDFFPK